MQNNSISKLGDVEQGPHDYWIYFKGKGNASIIIHAKRSFSKPVTDYKESDINGNVSQGWHTIYGEEKTIVP